MLFLVLVTLPYAAERAPAAATRPLPMPAAPTDLQRAARRGARPHGPDRRRPDARSLRDRPRRSHFAGSAGPGGPVRSRELPPGRRRQRRAQRRRARRPRRDRRRWSATTPKGARLRRRAARGRHRHRRAWSRTASRCTTRKLRVVTTRNQQVARIDYECDRAVDGDARGGAGRRRSATRRRAPTSSLVSDYQKGAITQATAQAAIDAARGARRAVAGRPEGAAHRLLRRRVAGHAQPPRGGSGDAACGSAARDEARTAAQRFRERARLRERAHHARRARHVAARPRRRVRSPRRGARGRPTSPAPATPSSPRWRSAWPRGGSLQHAARLANRAAGLAVAPLRAGRRSAPSNSRAALCRRMTGFRTDEPRASGFRAGARLRGWRRQKIAKRERLRLQPSVLLPSPRLRLTARACVG